jgi:hypothetical protein
MRNRLRDDLARINRIRLLHVEEDADPGLAHSPCSFVHPRRMRGTAAA